MGMFSRFTDIINANINSMLDKAEQPEKMIRLIIGEMEETLVEVRSTAAKTIAEQKTLSRHIAGLQKQSDQWTEKAALALVKGREDLARAALVEKTNSTDKITGLTEQLSIIEETLAAIQNDSQRLQEKLNEARRRQESLVIRQQSATARLKVREQIETVNINDTINKFERYQQRVETVEAKVEAFELTTASDLDNQFKALAAQESVERELSALKQKVANG